MVVRITDAQVGDLGETARRRIAHLQPLESKHDKRKAASMEDRFAFQLRAYQTPPFERDFRFAKQLRRQWRLDFAFPHCQLAVEIEGLTVRRIAGELVCTGRHATVAGFNEDCIKYSAAALLGWTVIRFTPAQVRSNFAINMTRRVLMRRFGWRPPA